MELLDVYNKDKQKIGKIVERGSGIKLKEDEYFLYVQCCILNNENKILITRRDFAKPYGGRWETTGGCVSSGETSLQGIQRELGEEIGVFVQENELNLIKTIETNEENLNCFRDVYFVKKDIDLNDLKFQEGEVIDAKYVTIEQLNEMISNDEVCEWLEFLKEEYYKIIN